MIYGKEIWNEIIQSLPACGRMLAMGVFGINPKEKVKALDNGQGLGVCLGKCQVGRRETIN